MLKSIRFKFGPTPDATPIEIAPGPMTVIVGPNNSGKSLTLRELQYSLGEAQDNWDSNHWKVLADVEPSLPPPGELRDSILHDIRSTLALIRPPGASSDPGIWEALAMLVGKTPVNLDLLNTNLKWPRAVDKIKRTTESLIDNRKLHPSPPVLSAAPLEALIQAGWVGLQEWLPAEQRALLELIHAVNERSDEALIADGTINFRGYYIHYRRQSMLLDGSARLGLAHGEPCGSLHDAPTGNIMRLWQQRQNLERLRALVLDAFGLHVCIDLMNLGQARLVLSDKPPPAGIEDRLDAEARGFIAAARPLHEFSDGVRTYIGLHTQLIAQDSRFVMIDEPEAFLHPPLARRLGANLSTLAAERGSCVFAATHSPDFLMGCIESGVDVNIVRLGYRNNIATAHLLPQDELKAMMVDPLLRSTGILGAVFHQAAVVVEGDSDRTFYSEVTERLRLHEPATHPAVMRDCVFLNAQGKATVSRILAALRRLGVVSCGIIDLDLLRDPHTCTRLLQAAGASASTRETITDLRAKIARDIEDLADLCEPRGLARASREERKDVNRFIDELETHGIFLPEVGTLEGWLSQLGVDSTNRKAWIPAIFQAMGPVHTGLAPAPGDVWAFIRRIGQFLEYQGAPHSPDAPST
jgi:energy-coupling factor transporter ATP-binding protein EcfA2